MAQNTTPTGKIITEFERLSDPNLATKGSDITTSMANNVANFPNPEPPLAAVLTALNEYSDALIAAKTRERTAVAVKNQKRAVLIALLKQLANYVTFTANGDTPVLSSS